MSLLRKAGAADAVRIRYEDDPYSWALQQAELLRSGRSHELDLVNLADEIADVAGREYDKLESALMRLLQHLLKWDHQPDRRSRSWVVTTREHRARVRDQLDDNPGLKAALQRASSRAYRKARAEALNETNLPEAALPDTLPYGWEEIMSRPIVWQEP